MTCTEAMNAVALRDRLQALVTESMLLICRTGGCPFCPADHGGYLRTQLRHDPKCALRLAQEELERTS